jgi:hypothetical protein
MEDIVIVIDGRISLEEVTYENGNRSNDTGHEDFFKSGDLIEFEGL